jgi:hypothetical protein
VFFVKITSKVITVIGPKAGCDPDDRVRKVPIATKNGHLLIKRLRRFLIAQEQSQLEHPDDPVEVRIPGEIILKIVNERHKMTNSLKRMGNALDRKSATIVDLNKQLDEAINIATRYREFCSLITGSFTDLLDAAAGYRDAITGDDIKVQMEKYEELSRQIDESAQMIEDLPKMEELEAAKEEEKDDQC